MNPYASDMRYMPEAAPGGNMMTSEKDIKENTTENKAENLHRLVPTVSRHNTHNRITALFLKS